MGSEQQNLVRITPKQNFAHNGLDQNLGTKHEPNYVGHDLEHNFKEDEARNGFFENELKQDCDQNVQNEMDNGLNNLHHEEKQQCKDSRLGSGEEEKWPGWPGVSVFRMLVPTQKAGNIIGPKGEHVKKIVEETKARIKVLDGPPRTTIRAVMVSAREEPDASLPPAVDGLLRVHKRVVDGLDDDLSQAPPAGGKISTRMLLPSVQAGNLIGKQGATVKSIQETANCIVRVLGTDELPYCAFQDDRVVEIVGEPAGVHKAVELIATHLRKYLLDRSLVPLIETQMQVPPSHVEHMPPQPLWDLLHNLLPNGGVPSYGPNPQYMKQPKRDNYYPPADLHWPPERPPHQGISAYGREPPLSVHSSSDPQAASTATLKVTQYIQVPLAYADAVIGANGSRISYVRRASGANVTIQEAMGNAEEMTAEINGTASQVQAAQQLIQNFMAEAAAQPQMGGSGELSYNQAYSSYAAPVAHATQPAGAYGSVYGANYGY